MILLRKCKWAAPLLAFVCALVMVAPAGGAVFASGDGERGVGPEQVFWPAGSYSLSFEDEKFYAGETREVLLLAEGENATDLASWRSENPDVATVDELGIVTAVGVGETNIICEISDDTGNIITLTCVVTVLDSVVPPPPPGDPDGGDDGSDLGDSSDPGDDTDLGGSDTDIPSCDTGGGNVVVQPQDNKTATVKPANTKYPARVSGVKVSAGKKKITVRWKKLSGKLTGYRIQYRQKGTSKWKTKFVSYKYSKLTVKNLKKGKRYQVRVRAYRTVSSTIYLGPWSLTKTSAKVRK
jgi:hypothetical protein